ncbi:hypothetical protein BJX76DRAFT_326182 [Aspergillus varians]
MQSTQTSRVSHGPKPNRVVQTVARPMVRCDNCNLSFSAFPVSVLIRPRSAYSYYDSPFTQKKTRSMPSLHVLTPPAIPSIKARIARSSFLELFIPSFFPPSTLPSERFLSLSHLLALPPSLPQWVSRSLKRPLSTSRPLPLRLRPTLTMAKSTATRRRTSGPEVVLAGSPSSAALPVTVSSIAT